MSLGFVVIGRNEGERLRYCLQSIVARAAPVVYADSGSTDGSVDLARSFGVAVVVLDDSAPFTAARGRNAGFAMLRQTAPETCLVQFVDGDCEIVEGWIETALATLEAHPDVAVVCGRRRERHPEQSVYTWLCDIEWNTPVGEALACGGDAMMRAEALLQVGGYRSEVIAGEDDELCVRLRREGWKIQRLDADMTLHDVRLVCLGQWWRRTMRAGHGYAEVSRLHSGPPEYFWRKQKLRAVFWAGILPVMIGGGSFVHPVALVPAVLYPLQIARVALRRGVSRKSSWVYAFFMMLAKFAELIGIARFLWRSWIAKKRSGPIPIADERKRRSDSTKRIRLSR